MTRRTRTCILFFSGAVLLQLGGCLANVLTDVFFAVGPFLL